MKRFGLLVSGVVVALVATGLMPMPMPGAAAAAPTVAVGDARMVEGDIGDGPVGIPITLSAPSTVPVVVRWNVIGGTATRKQDFNKVKGTTTFKAGQISDKVALRVFGDGIVEGNETVVVQLGQVTGATVSDGSGVLTMVDNDANGVALVPEVSAGRATVSEGHVGKRLVEVPVTLSRPSPGPALVNVRTQCGFAGATFAPGQVTSSVKLPYYGDVSRNGNRFFRRDTAISYGFVVMTATKAELAVTDDDGAVSPTPPVLAVDATIRASETAARFDSAYPDIECQVGGSGRPSISATGRYVAFASEAVNLVPNDQNTASDIFVKDTVTGAVERVSVNNAGVEGNRASEAPVISADGRFVVFLSSATNLVPNDNFSYDLFVYDRVTKTIDKVYAPAVGFPWGSRAGTISADGRYIAFATLVPLLGDTDPCPTAPCEQRDDIYVVDRTTAALTHVTNGLNGAPRSGFLPRISANGLTIAYFTTEFPNPQAVSSFEVVAADWTVGTSEIATVNSAEQRLQGWGNDPNFYAISADGHKVAFAAMSCNFGVTCSAPLTNGIPRVYLRDRDTGTTSVVSTTPAGVPLSNPVSGAVAISDDGRYVTFEGDAPEYVPSGYNVGGCRYNVFQKDLVTGAATMVARAPGNQCPNAYVDFISPGSSADGSYVAYDSLASNLAPNDLNAKQDVFVRRIR
jgi:Tol biopolymer transport system component